MTLKVSTESLNTERLTTLIYKNNYYQITEKYMVKVKSKTTICVYWQLHPNVACEKHVNMKTCVLYVCVLCVGCLAGTVFLTHTTLWVPKPGPHEVKYCFW